MVRPQLEYHLSCALHTGLSQEQIAELYRPLGWRVRKCSWDEYEILCEWAELIISDAGCVLMHGQLSDAPANADHVLRPLRDAGVGYEAEFYDEDHELLQQCRWESS